MRPLPPKMVPGVPVTLSRTQRIGKCTQKARCQTGAHDGAPRALTRARGGFDDPGVCLVRRRARPSSWCEKSRKTQQKGKKNNRKKRPKHPCRLASRKRASEEFQENPKNAWAQNGAPRKHQEAGRTAKKGEQTNAAGQEKEQEKATEVRVGVCPVTT